MYLVINNENHHTRASDNICLIYGKNHNKVQIIIIDNFKVRQGVVATHLRSDSKEANPFRVLAESFQQTTIQYISH